MTNDNVLSPADFWPRILHAIALVLPFALFTAGTGIDRTAGAGGDIAIYLDHLAAAPGWYLASGILMAVGMALLIPCAAALIRLTAGLQRTAVLRAGAIFIGIWGVCGIAGVSLGYTAGWVGVDIADSVATETLRRVFEGVTYSPWGLIGGGLGGVAYVLGMLATGIGLILARGVPSWTGVLLLAAPVASFTGGPLGIPILTTGGFLIAAIGLAGTIPALLQAPHLFAVSPTLPAPVEEAAATSGGPS